MNPYRGASNLRFDAEPPRRVAGWFLFGAFWLVFLTGMAVGAMLAVA